MDTVKIPEELKPAIAAYLDQHPGWDGDRLIAAALALYLMQNTGTTSTSPVVKQVYLSTTFSPVFTRSPFD